MDKKEKAQILQGIEEGDRSVKDLQPCRIYMLDLGKITYFANFDHGSKDQNVTLTVQEFVKEYQPNKVDRDFFCTIAHTSHNLPPELDYCDPSGAVIEELIKVLPDLDNDHYRQLIQDCKDLRKTRHHEVCNTLTNE